MRQVEQALGTPVQIRARRAALYAEAPEPRPGLHRGHIPGSINIPYGELLENGRFKSLEALRQTFSDKGVDINGPIITSCGSGVTAAVLAFGCCRSARRRSSCMTAPERMGPAERQAAYR